MNQKLKRYDLYDNNFYPCHRVEESINGKYVTYEDYQKLQEHLKDLISESLKIMRNRIVGFKASNNVYRVIDEEILKYDPKYQSFDSARLRKKTVIDRNDEIERLKNQLLKAEKVILFYADKKTYKDLWKLNGRESEHFKYFYIFRDRTKDFENLSIDANYHFYAGKRARQYFKEKENP